MTALRLFSTGGADTEFETPAGHVFVAIGRRHHNVVALDKQNGEVVVFADGPAGGAAFVNSSAEKFHAFVRICEARYPFYSDDDGGDFDVSEAAAEKLRTDLLRIDERALTPGSLWSDFISDVANGDYGG